MKVWVYVEGESDRLALDALWGTWNQQLRQAKHHIHVIPLENKSKFFKSIGPRAAEKICNNSNDLVVGLPDLYPNREFETTKYKHDNLEQLQECQRRLAKRALRDDFGVSKPKLDLLLDRFFPTALKHDLEMLLLASREQLTTVLGAKENLGEWTEPVEDQNQQNPPKHVVEKLFREKAKEAYRDTNHAPAVLRKVSDIRTVLYTRNDRLSCPVFKEMLDWIGKRMGIRAYS
ncbi:MAG: DUF4276 family protein [Phycisphaerae bacterium]|nr:DUF4276 family protein [Phycisphaerae bacterium]